MSLLFKINTLVNYLSSKAICSIVSSIKRSQIGLRDKKRPMSSSMFAGPTVSYV